MKTLFRHFLVVAVCLVLALPPGSCGAVAQHARAGSSPEKASCCHQTAPNRPCDSGQAPALPGIDCCCARDAVLPEKSVQPNDSFNVPLVAAADHFSMDVGSLMHGEAIVTPAPSLRSLQVLLC